MNKDEASKLTLEDLRELGVLGRLYRAGFVSTAPIKYLDIYNTYKSLKQQKIKTAAKTTAKRHKTSLRTVERALASVRNFNKRPT